MFRTFILVCSFIIPLTVIAQENAGRAVSDTSYKGVVFETSVSSWAEIVSKARASNKLIFIDCYATWCVPCKVMDKTVYPEKEAGDYFNSKFFCVKLQMDSTKNDAENIRQSRSVADFIANRYKVDAYPTLLFFDSEGRLVNRFEGGMLPRGLIDFAKSSFDPQKDYYKMLAQYESGNYTIGDLDFLAMRSLTLGDTTKSMEISQKYILTVTEKKIPSKEDLLFCSRFTTTPEEIGFLYFIHHRKEINDIMTDTTYSQDVVSNILFKNFVQPELQKCETAENIVPDWQKVARQIRTKYGKYYADRVVLHGKISWFAYKKEWNSWAKYYVEYFDDYTNMEISGHWVAYAFNNAAWSVFQHTDDRDALKKALSWSAKAVLMEPASNWMDTYANLLYKLNETSVAIQWEKLAVLGEPKNKAFAVNLKKMEDMQPTW